ncbi:MAG TPA: YidC/Oxa1 family membrane protein insertase [Gemmatimonadales bacterium]|nr:YidC/Oxa1 family membrane protein insertase [Gemmatimonadales bacterium]
MPPLIAAGFLGIEHFTPPWDVFFLPLFNLLVLFYRLVFNDFALAIIVFTVVIRTVLAPLFVRQIRSQKEMQRMQPLIKEVQRKHKGNRQKISEETMALYKEHGVNPAAGCLPVVLQLPILWALYQALIRASGDVTFNVTDALKTDFAKLQSALNIQQVAGTTDHWRVPFEGACNLPELSRPEFSHFLPLNCQLIDPVKLHQPVDTVVNWLFNLDLAKVDHTFSIVLGGENGFALSFLAVVAAALQFVQVKMTTPRPNPDDPTSGATSTMSYLFPLMTIFWGGIFPSGLILYWIVYTAYLVVQQFLIMGWGNLFPIFGWQPAFAASGEAALVSGPAPRREAERKGEERRADSPQATRPAPSRPAPERAARQRTGQKRRGRKR